MSTCVCNGLGVYVDGDDHGEQLHVFPCDEHPLAVGKDESADGVAGARVDECLEGIAAIRDLLWPRGYSNVEWSPDTAEAIGHAMNFLRPPECDHPTVRNGECLSCGEEVVK